MLEDGSYKIKYTLTIGFRIHTLIWIYPRELKPCPHKNVHVDVHNDFIHNCQKLETTKMPFTDVLWYIQTMEYYSTLKRIALSSHEKTWKNLKHILLNEKKRSKKTASHLIPTI